MAKPRVFGTKDFIYSMIGTIIVIGIVLGIIFIIRATKKKKKLVTRPLIPLVKPPKVVPLTPLTPACPEHCLTCDKDGKKCLTCKQGYEKPDKNCTVKVQVKPLKPLTCFKNCAVCTDGKCTKCKTGWQNLNKSCLVHECPFPCGHGKCSHVTGKCVCTPGTKWTGEHCDRQNCDKGYYWSKDAQKCWWDDCRYPKIKCGTKCPTKHNPPPTGYKCLKDIGEFCLGETCNNENGEEICMSDYPNQSCVNNKL
jgi:hypothetical protein